MPSKEGPEEDLVATCAEDSQVVLFSVAQFEKQHPSKLTAMPSAPALSVSPSASALLARHHDRVDVWGMPECAAPGKGATEGQLLTPDAAPVLLKRIRPDALAGPLCAAAASPDGAWVAVSDRRATRAFLATDAGDVGVDDRSLPPASALSFVGESRLALAGSSGGLWVYDMAGDEESEGGEGQPSGTPKQLLSVKSCDGPIHVLERDGDLLLACSRRRAWVFDVRKGELVASVPSPQGPITCGAVRHKQGIVLLASATNDVVLFDAFKQKVGATCR